MIQKLAPREDCYKHRHLPLRVLCVAAGSFNCSVVVWVAYLNKGTARLGRPKPNSSEGAIQQRWMHFDLPASCAGEQAAFSQAALAQDPPEPKPPSHHKPPSRKPPSHKPPSRKPPSHKPPSRKPPPQKQSPPSAPPPRSTCGSSTSTSLEQGPFGAGPSGSAYRFDDTRFAVEPISAITVMSGPWIDSIQVIAASSQVIVSYPVD